MPIYRRHLRWHPGSSLRWNKPILPHPHRFYSDCCLLWNRSARQLPGYCCGYHSINRHRWIKLRIHDRRSGGRWFPPLRDPALTADREYLPCCPDNCCCTEMSVFPGHTDFDSDSFLPFLLSPFTIKICTLIKLYINIVRFFSQAMFL